MNFIPSAKRSKKAKHKIYMYNKMNKDKWEEFRENTQQMFLEKIDKVIITNKKELNRVWNKQNSIVKQAMNRYILYTVTSPHQFFALSLKATKLHSALKNINKTLQILQLAKPPITTGYIMTKINRKLSKINKLSEKQIPMITKAEMSLSFTVIKEKLNNVKNDI